MPLRSAAPSLLVLLPACAVPARYVDPRTDSERTLQQVATELADADVVFLGEIHDSQAVHKAHLELIQALHLRRPAMAISMEMFERDVQSALYQYLQGLTDEATFLASSRPWDAYRTDYRPVVEWARSHRVPVIAANVPRPLAAKVSKEGLESVRGEPHAAREVSTPDDLYFAAFKVEMGNLDSDAMRRYYAAQCLKDDTMAESIVDFLREERQQGRTTMVVHICGRMHSDHRRGTVARVSSRQPDWKVRVLSVDEVADLRDGMFQSHAGVGDYVILVPRQERKEKAAHEHDTAAAPPHQPKDPHAPVHGAGATTDHGGGRPGLGLRPAYGAAAAGMLVDTVTEGGAAAAAGIQDGDLVVELAGQAIDDVQGYSDVLNTLRIGDTVDVVVKRGGETRKLKVKVGVSSR